jgi:dTDP-4-dehydrorhamnose reductase
MRLLVTGAGGLLGGRLASLLRARHAVIAGVHRAPAPEGLPSLALDLTRAEVLEPALDEAEPEAVLHAAALADADRCEADPELATALNVQATERLARACHGRGIRLVVLSTDMVFSGERGLWREADPATPSLVYGRSKKKAEEAALESGVGAAVLRVALVHGQGHGARRTASEAILDALRGGRRLRLFTDQYRTPVDPESVAEAVERVLDRRVAGLFHVGGPERLSRHQLGARVAALFGLDAGLIDPVRAADHPTGAPRPKDVSLDCSRARRELGWVPRSLDEGLRQSRLGAG